MKKERLWEESKHYSVGYLANFIREWKTRLLKNQNRYLSGTNSGRKETLSTESMVVSYKEGDLTESYNLIAFPWNRAHQMENKLQEDLHRDYGTLEIKVSGVSIGEVATMKRRPQREGGYIYGLIVKRDSESLTEMEVLREALTQMRDHAVENTVGEIDFPEK